MNLPSPVELSGTNVEIEDAHTPVPRGGFSGGSPTGEVSGTPGRKQRERKHSGRCFVTLKRKGTRDVVRQTHARSASGGSVFNCGCSVGGGGGGKTPKADLACSDLFTGGGNGSGGNGSGSESVGYGHDKSGLESVGPLCTAVGPPPPPSPQLFRRASASGSGSGSGSAGGPRGGEGSVGLPSGSALASLQDAAQRIAVDPDTGHSFFVERSTVCDACPSCEDVCEVAWCKGCSEKRVRLEKAYGSLALSADEIEEAAAGDGPAVDGRDCPDSGGRIAHAPPVLSRRYPRKAGYTLCEVRRRKLTGACWIISQGSVYDVTAALADHPGGKRSVLRNAGGRDCAEDFSFHSRAAKKQWRQYRIGSLVTCRGEMLDGGVVAEGRGGEGDVAELSMRTASDCVIS